LIAACRSADFQIGASNLISITPICKSALRALVTGVVLLHVRLAARAA
jgi:hypothetical protein